MATLTDVHIARLQKDVERLDAIVAQMRDQLPPLDRSFNDLDRSVSVHQAAMKDVPERVAKLEHWKAGEVGDIPGRVVALERWKYTVDGALGLTRWAVTGGIMGVIALLTVLLRGMGVLP
jgi:hypothetical protein